MVESTLLLLAYVTRAEYPPGDNLLEIYTQDDGTGYCDLGIVTGVVTLHLTATGLTDPSGISGWQCLVFVPAEVQGTIIFLGVTSWGVANNAAPAPDFAS